MSLQNASAFNERWPDEAGHFGAYGGKFVPETLMSPLEELDRAYEEALADPGFGRELERLASHYVGRPTPLTLAPRLSERVGAAVARFVS